MSKTFDKFLIYLTGTKKEFSRSEYDKIFHILSALLYYNEMTIECGKHRSYFCKCDKCNKFSLLYSKYRYITNSNPRFWLKLFSEKLYQKSNLTKEEKRGKRCEYATRILGFEGFKCVESPSEIDEWKTNMHNVSDFCEDPDNLATLCALRDAKFLRGVAKRNFDNLLAQHPFLLAKNNNENIDMFYEQYPSSPRRPGTFFEDVTVVEVNDGIIQLTPLELVSEKLVEENESNKILAAKLHAVQVERDDALKEACSINDVFNMADPPCIAESNSQNVANPFSNSEHSENDFMTNLSETLSPDEWRAMADCANASETRKRANLNRA